MKSTGIVRDVDNLGRIVLPIELRRTLGINVKDSVEIYTDNDTIILRKYQQSCIFCGANESLSEYRGKMICSRCAGEINIINK
ncbi:MAG: AbrB/MazE/SpoVT family DNA-binding domain-containing protein [Ruminococcus sp.]|nr:AbrB/MazE/SpoVT family DNA-binding domain-containing protein [Ruminococcus sp.]